MKKGKRNRPPVTEVEEENVAQSTRRVKDKRPKGRAFGILDPPCCRYYSAAKGLIPTPVKQG